MMESLREFANNARVQTLSNTIAAATTIYVLHKSYKVNAT